MTTNVPSGLGLYKRTALFTESSIPAGLLSDHATKRGVWGLIHVTQGALRYVVTDPRRASSDKLLTAEGEPGLVEPTILHRVEPVGSVQFHVEFLRSPPSAGGAQRIDSEKSSSGRRAFAQHRRADKRAAAEQVGVDSRFIDDLVEAFYAKIREDGLLGPIFAERIGDWPMHLARMKAFWRSVLHNSGEFSGNPMLKHIAIPGLEVRHFAHWLDLFYETLRDAEVHRAATELVGARARIIADSLLTAISMRRDGLAGGREGEDLPHA